jgi:small GTP-binding protein
MIYKTKAYFLSVLRYIGLIPNKKAKIVFLGLDNAGKTTLLNLMKNDRVQVFFPTQHPTSEELTLCGVTFKIFDIGGHTLARRLWRDYYVEMDALVFVIDASDESRLTEAATELHHLVRDIEDKPVLILGNKIDVPGAMSEYQLREALSLLTYSNVHVVMCSLKLRCGYVEGFRWLTERI